MESYRSSIKDSILVINVTNKLLITFRTLSDIRTVSVLLELTYGVRPT